MKKGKTAPAPADCSLVRHTPTLHPNHKCAAQPDDDPPIATSLQCVRRLQNTDPVAASFLPDSHVALLYPQQSRLRSRILTSAARAASAVLRPTAAPAHFAGDDPFHKSCQV